MSRYKEIKTEIKSAESLLKALGDMGLIIDRQGTLHKNQVVLANRWGHEAAHVDFYVSRESLASLTKDHYFSAPLGFAWNEETSQYGLVFEDMDTYRLTGVNFQGRLMQQYAYNEVVSKAGAQGYTISRENVDGVIRLTCVKR
jgi:hypothetical protein